MAQLNLINMKGADAGTLDVSDAVFAVDPNKNAVRQALLAYEANQRQGTHSTKTRAFVRGGGRKPFRQKGTGRARQGSSRAPQYRGGAIIFGPQPRGYDQKVNKKVKRLALNSALSDLRAQNRVKVLSDLTVTEPKTKAFKAMLSTIGVGDDQRVLLLVIGGSTNLLLAARNLPNVLVLPVQNINIHSLLTADVLITSPEAVKQLEEALAS
ncbi:50S ribosomal protein L4 [candidate division BRC1 bacterium HGW-BRC1-1]|nr:ribosomal protein L4 [uncultured bacterium]PKO18653.1 MAG: 50S ribosomal protein L4 [candidate division BRC1 bacterium HGW-BRC1-1]